MKYLYTYILCIFIALFSFVPAQAQLTVGTAGNVNQYVTNLLGNGVTVSNIVVNCNPVAIGTFAGGNSTNLGINTGTFLSTGYTVDVLAGGPNPPTTDLFGAGDGDLQNAIGGTSTFDACTIEFDLVPSCDSIAINYVFASSEYDFLVNFGLLYDDAFAFFISGPNPGGGNYVTQNIALVPGTGSPVSIGNVNNYYPSNPAYYVNNSGLATINYYGFTTQLTAYAAVTPCQTYHLKLVVADGLDEFYDSGVFLQANGIGCASPSAIITAGGPTTFCPGASVLLTANFAAGFTYQWNNNSIPIAGANGQTYNATTTGNYSVTINFGGCSYTSNIIPVNVNAADASWTPFGPLCQTGAAVNLPPYITGTTGGTWSGMGVTGSTFNPAGLSGSIPVTYTVGSGSCVATQTHNIVVNAPSGSAAFSYSAGSFCQTSGTQNITLGAGATAGIFSYTGAGTLSLNTTTGEFNPSTSTAGTYTVTNTVASIPPCANITASQSVTIVAPSIAAFTYPSPIICQTAGTQNITLGAGATSGTFTYTSAGGGFLSLNATTGAINPGLSTPDTYNVINTVTGTAPCANAIDVQAISIILSPVVTISPTNPAPVCVGASVQLDALPANAGITYQWYESGVAIVGATNSTYFATTSGTYTVQATAAGCTSLSSAVNVTVSPVPTATITPLGATTFCSGNSVTLNANAGAGYTYQWYESSVAIVGATGASYVANTAGTYTVEVILGTCSTTSLAEIVTINPLPTATITPAGATTFCVGGNVNLDATTGVGYSYQWNLNGVAIAGATNAAYLANTSGNYTVTVTENGCTATSSAVVVTVNPMPVANISPASATTFCAGGSVVLNGSVGANYTYQWNENGVAIAGATNASYTATTSGSYTLSISALGCVATSSAVNVIVNPIPNATFSYDANVYCLSAANPVLSFPTGGTAGNFTVTPNGLNFNTSTGDVTIAGSLTGTYIVTNSLSANGCVSSASDTITLSNVLDATFTYGGLVFCQTGNNPSPAYPNGGGAGTFTANPTIGLSMNVANGVIDLALSTPGTYTLTNTLPAGACAGAPFSLTITIAPGLNAEFTYPSNVYCLNSGTNPTVSHNNGGTDGIYSAVMVSGGAIALDPNTGTINLATSTAGVYNIFNTLAPNGGCTGEVFQQTVTLENPADATFAYDNTAYCQNGANPVLTHPIGATDGMYSTVPNAGLSYNFATGAIDLSASVPGTYTVTNDIAAGLACAASSYSQTLTIDAAPSAQFEYDASNYCSEGDAPVLTHTIGTDGVYSYVVLNGGPLLSMTPTNGSIALLGSDVGTYQITNIVPANGVCSADTQTRSISIVPQPDAEFFYPKELYCGAGETPIALHLTGVNGIYAYSGGTNLALNPTTGEINLAASSLGTYFVTNIVQSGNVCPADSNTALLIYSEQPFADLNPVGTVDLCTNGSVNLQANGGGNYNWFYGNMPLGVATGNYTTNTPGDYFVIVSNDAGCADTSAILSVIGGSQPSAEIQPAQTQICEGQSLALSATGSGNFQWLLNGNALSGETNSTLQVSAGGVYTFVVNNACGTDTANITVNVSPGPQADFFATPNPAYTGETTVFTDQSISGALWAWDFGVNGASSILQNPTYTYTETGIYNVTAYIEDVFGCKDTVSHTINVIFASPDSLFIPNVFSPNGDEIYEVWNIYAIGLTDFKVSVYDRWGVKAFETISPNEKWNGTRPNGAECEAGVYYYSVTFTDNKNNKVVKKGNLTLLR